MDRHAQQLGDVAAISSVIWSRCLGVPLRRVFDSGNDGDREESDSLLVLH